jgi:hypothetical protein
MKLLVFVFALLLIGCEQSKNAVITQSNVYGVYQERIDGCEYIVATIRGSGSGVSIIHKMNCDNPQHKGFPLSEQPTYRR